MPILEFSMRALPCARRERGGTMADQVEVKSHDTPDETRTPEKTRVEIVHVGALTLGRFTFQPGWRWSECIKPVVHTESCQVHHVGHVVSGSITVRLDNG